MSDDDGERGLAEPRWAAKQNMIHCLATAPRGLNRNRQILDHLGLPGKVREALRPECRFKLSFVFLWRGRGHAISRHVSLTLPHRESFELIASHRTRARAARNRGSNRSSTFFS